MTAPARSLIRYSTAAGRWVLLATVLGSSLAFVDSTVVNIALPAIGRDLAADAAGLQWTINGYALSLAALILLGGSLGDRYGRRRVFMVGIGWFATSSLLCGIAPNIETLIAARVLQGIGGALLTPGAFAVLEASFVREDRARAIGLHRLARTRPGDLPGLRGQRRGVLPGRAQPAGRRRIPPAGRRHRPALDHRPDAAALRPGRGAGPADRAADPDDGRPGDLRGGAAPDVADRGRRVVLAACAPRGRHLRPGAVAAGGSADRHRPGRAGRLACRHRERRQQRGGPGRGPARGGDPAPADLQDG